MGVNNVFFEETDSLSHIGVKRKSGRYPWGSGDRPYQSESSAYYRFRSNKKRRESTSDSDKNTEPDMVSIDLNKANPKSLLTTRRYNELKEKRDKYTISDEEEKELLKGASDAYLLKKNDKKELKTIKKLISDELKDRKYEKAADSKHRGILTDEDLSKKTQRLKDEKEFKRLTEEDIHPGRVAVKNFLSEIAKDVAKDVAKDALKGVAKYNIRKMVGEKDEKGNPINGSVIAEYLKPKKK